VPAQRVATEATPLSGNLAELFGDDFGGGNGQLPTNRTFTKPGLAPVPGPNVLGPSPNLLGPGLSGFGTPAP